MKLIDTTNMPIDKSRVYLQLADNFHMFYPRFLEGGGYDNRFEFVNAVRFGGNDSIYNRCLEWCAGHGILGFSLLVEQLCKHITFMDYYDVAIKECYFTAEANERLQDMDGYISSTIAGLPNLEKFDLVIGNPPNANDENILVTGLKKDAAEQNEQILYMENTLRITLDQDYEIHKEFFNNIRSRITDDADIFISVTHYENPEIPKMISKNDLKLVYQYPLPSMGHTCRIWHIKPI